MPNLEKCVRAAVIGGKNWKHELYKFLREYRATPHTTTNVSPSEALNGRKLNTTLPKVSPAQARQQTLQETRKTNQAISNREIQCLRGNQRKTN